MIDDRLDVHHAVRDTVPCRCLFGQQQKPAPGRVPHTLRWADVEDAVIADL